jgi:hypothetical protein
MSEFVILANAGIQVLNFADWIPAFAGMTEKIHVPSNTTLCKKHNNKNLEKYKENYKPTYMLNV